MVRSRYIELFHPISHRTPRKPSPQPPAHILKKKHTTSTLSGQISSHIYSRHLPALLRISFTLTVQSTGQKSHRVNTTSWPSQCYVLIKHSDCPLSVPRLRLVVKCVLDDWSLSRASALGCWKVVAVAGWCFTCFGDGPSGLDA